MSIRWPATLRIVVLFLLLPVAAQSQDFSMVVIPDTQMYAELHPEIFEAQVNWIVANQAAENIVYVAHLGDLKDDLSCDDRTVNEGSGAGRTEWQIVDDTLALLDTANIPYGVVPGNHDFDSLNPGLPSETCPNFTTERPLGLYNTRLGPSRFDAPAAPGYQPTYGDTDPLSPFFGETGNRTGGSNEDNFSLVESSGVKFVIINLGYRQVANEVTPASPICNNSELPWADTLLKNYSDRLGIITSHYFLDQNPGNAFGSYGQCVYDFLKNNPNLFMMLGAHERGEAWRQEMTDRGGMEPVHVLLQDYQSVRYAFRDGDPGTPEDMPTVADIEYDRLFGATSNHGDSGFMRIMRFDTTMGEVNIETFTPAVSFTGLSWDLTSGRHSGHSHLDRAIDLVSDYSPASGAGMDNETASTFSISYLGYVPSGPFYVDADGDTFGDSAAAPVPGPSLPPGFSVNNLDCDDTDASINPDATETANLTDDNCNGTVDEAFRYVFVSSTTTNGNIGGVAGADSTCQALADASSLPAGSYKAWISEWEWDTYPAQRLVRSTLPYVRPDGVQVTADWWGLWNVDNDAPINVTETGGSATIDPIYGATVWATTNSDGINWNGEINVNLWSCLDWTSASPADEGASGRFDQTDRILWSNGLIDVPCDRQRHLYCLQE